MGKVFAFCVFSMCLRFLQKCGWGAMVWQHCGGRHCPICSQLLLTQPVGTAHCRYAGFPLFLLLMAQRFCEKWPPALYFGKDRWGCRACHDKRGPFFRKMESRPAAKRKGERNNKKEAPSQGLAKPEEHMFWIHKHSFFQIRLKTLQWIAAKTMA